MTHVLTTLECHPCEELEGGGDVGVRGPEQRFPKLQRALVERLRLRVLALPSQSSSSCCGGLLDGGIVERHVSSSA